LKPPRLLIIEDDWIVANGLREMLRYGGAEVVGVASRAEQVDALVQQHAPALALVDIDLGRGGDGVEVAEGLVAAGVGVVFTSVHTDEATLTRVKDVGASGFVVKPFSQAQIRVAIALALATQAAPRERAAAHVEKVRQALAELAQVIGAAPPAQEIAIRLRRDPRLAALSERERAVLHGLVEHRRVPAIAEHLGISAHTVRNHLKAVFAKFRVSSQQELLDEILERPLPAVADRPKVASAKHHSTPYARKIRERRR
jgi:DNA-binding NarL/FixJ family response regulator